MSAMVLSLGAVGSATDAVTDHGDERGGALQMCGLADVMSLERGRPEVAVGVIDGPLCLVHEALSTALVAAVPPATAFCDDGCRGSASAHGTAVAGILVADRATPATGICPGVRLLVRPIFDDHEASTSPATLAAAIVECIDAGAWILNISAAYDAPMTLRDSELDRALDHAARSGVIVVVATGNGARIGGSALVSHPWVIPVTSCDTAGRPLAAANLGRSIARQGLCAPGVGITAVKAGGGYGPFGGTSAAAPLVTGAIALAWSAAPEASSAAVRAAAGARHDPRRRGMAPPLLDARQIYDRVVRLRGWSHDEGFPTSLQVGLR